MFEATVRVSADDDTEPPATSAGSRKSTMEANHCKNFENVPAAGERRATGMMRYYYSKRQESSFGEKGKRDALPPLEKHLPHPTTDCRDCSSLLPCNNVKQITGGSGCLEHIKKGCFYEINHTKLPPRVPVQLKSVPAVMVSDKTELNVTVKFPSVSSLRTYFTTVHHEDSDHHQIQPSNERQFRTTRNFREKMHPELDEQFVMGLKLAEEVLVRQILSSDFAKQKHLWLLPPPPLSVPRAPSRGTGVISTPPPSPVMVMPSSSQRFNSSNSGSRIVRRYDSNLMRRRGNCWSELVNSTGLLHWGIRRRVAFLSSHNDNRNFTPVVPPAHHHHRHQSSSMNLVASEEEEEEEEEEENEVEEEEEIEEEKEVEEEEQQQEQEMEEEKEKVEEQEMEEDKEEVEEQEMEEEVEAEVMGTKMDDDDEEEEEEEEMENGDCRIIKTTTAITTTEDYQSRRRSSRRKRRCLAQNLNQMVLVNRSRATTNRSSAITNKKRKREDDKQSRRSGGSKALAVQKKPQLKIKVTSYDRWSKERYKTAEIKMLQIMKERGAIFGKPMLRRTLRAEARKHIGDTGLLDHLLKHTAGKLSPDGKDRFRRRHNADGEMEYWLEDAELVNIRKEAGIKDPFWTPPPGWMPGDNPSQDPNCARDIRCLQQEMSNLKKYVEQNMEAEKQQNKEGGGDHQALLLHGSTNPAAVVVSSVDNDPFYKLGQSQNAITTTTTPMSVDQVQHLKEGYEYLMKRKAQLERQLNEVSISLNEYQEEVLRVTSRREEADQQQQTTTKKSSVLTAVKETNKQNQAQNKEEITKLGGGGGGGVGENHQSGKMDDNYKSGDENGAAAAAGGVKETKSEKRQRLSGFRICKPQGTFLWPNSTSTNCTNPMLLSPHDLQYRPHLQSVDPTPLSVSPATSSTPPNHHHHHHQLLLQPPPPALQMQMQMQHQPKSPVKPLAERRAVPVKTITSSSIVNLNVLPVVPDHRRDYGGEDNISSIASSSPLQYHHHQQQQLTNSRELCGTPTSAPPQQQQQPRTLLLLPHVSCGKGGDDHQKKVLAAGSADDEEEAVMRCRTNTAATSGCTRSDLMSQLMHHQGKQKQKQQQQELFHQLQEQEEKEIKKQQGGGGDNHKYRHFISLL